MSTLQREILLDQALLPDVPFYNAAVYARIDGPIDVTVFERALASVIARHDALRIVFVPGDELPTQRILEDVSPELKCVDFSRYADAEARVQQWIRDAVGKPFVFDGTPLFRFSLLTVGPERHYWLTEYHHAIIDGWTSTSVVQEVADAYNALQAGRIPFEQPAPSYVEFVADDHAYVTSEQFRVDEAYWKNVYRDLPEPLFSRRHHVAPADVYRSNHAESILDEPTCAALRAFAAEQRVALSQIFIGAVYGYFARTGRRDEVAFGLFSRNRRTPAFERTAGLFSTTYSVWYRFGTQLTFLDLLRAIEQEARRGAPHRRFPVSDLVRTIGLSGTERPRPFDVTISFVTGRVDARFGDAPVEFRTLSNGVHPHGLFIYIEDVHEHGRIRLLLDGNCTLFSQVELQRMVARIECFLAAAVSNPHQSISALPLMPPAEMAQVVAVSSGNVIAPPERAGIHEWIEARAAATPQAIAVECNGDTLAYADLNTRANQGAYRLRTLGVGPEVFVGCCLERSIDLIVAMLSIWKAGGVYVPLDPEHPRDRLELLLSESRIHVLLTQSHLRERVPSGHGHTICVDGDDFFSSIGPTSNPGRCVYGDNAAYAIFTSGSSGSPKPVVVTHSNLVHLALRLVDLFVLHPHDRVLQFAATSWDTSFEEIVPSLLTGSRLVLRSPDMLDPVVFLRECSARRISLVDLPTTFFHEVVSGLSAGIAPFPESIHTVVIGGEAARADKLAEFMSVVPRRVRVINTFGLTEATAVSTSYEATHSLGQVPIGVPLPNVEAYLLDGHFERMPFDVGGELFMGGMGVARGYLNRPALTAERFVPNPFSSIPGARMYRTGDLGERRDDGAILFHGRADRQIKIRGIRVEPGEIEAVLSSHAGVGEVVVELRRIADALRLVAYVIPNRERAPAVDELRQYVRERLPGYMVPEAIVFLDQWPRLSSGKLDRRGLLAPTNASKTIHAAPRTPMEEIVAHAFANVLGLADVGRKDDFFELGGHSLLAMRLLSMLQSRVGFAAPMASVFQHSTVQALASHLDGLDGRANLIRPVPRNRGESPFPGLSSMERRLWFLERLHPQARAYQAPQGIRVVGPFDPIALRSSLHALAMRHEIMRTTYPEHDGQPIRRVSDVVNIPTRTRDISSVPEHEQQQALLRLIADEIVVPFDVENGSLTSLLIVRLAAEEHVLLLNQHHLITDEWSAGVLLREWSQLYEVMRIGGDPALPLLLYQYAEFARAEHEAISGEASAGSRQYWKQQLKGVPRLELPWLHSVTAPGPEARVVLRMAPETCRALRNFARKHGCTVFMVWYAAALVVFSRHSRQTDFGLGSVSANRDVEATANLLGFFTNRVILRTDLEGDPSFLELVHRARKTAIDTYRHQAVPFDVVVQDQGARRHAGEMPLYDVSIFQVTMPAAQATSNWSPFFDILPDGLTTAKNGLSIALMQTDDAPTEVHLVYDLSRVDAATVRRLLNHFEVLITDALEHPSKRLSELNLLSPGEIETLVEKNNPSTDDRLDLCIHEWFEQQVDRQPEAIAVEYGDLRVSYAELNDRANGLARRLRNVGVGPEVLVGLCVERSIEMVVGILAILKAGGAYVPIDPSWPRERIAWLVKDAAISTIVSQSSWMNRLPHEAQRIAVDESAPLASFPNLPPPHTSGKHAAYVLFTSGSTGKPKGVVVEHRQLVDYVRGIEQRFGFRAYWRYGLLSTFTADLGHTVLFPSLALGGTLRLISEERAMLPDELADEFELHPVDILKIAPTHLAALLTANRPERLLPRKRLVLGGEVTRWDLLDTVRRLAPSCVVTNHYGPTETTIGVVMFDEVPNVPRLHSPGPAIGRPRPNARAYVLDSSLSYVPMGVPGELYVGGYAVTRGYYNRPGLTAERFLPDPFSSELGARMYRTGDLACWNDEGNVEYIGRADHQVKIRGFRVELGEIEASLSAHASVRGCVVLAREDSPGDRRLVAYVVPDSEECPVDVLRMHLGKTLPDYMIPAAFVFLSSLPLTSNGKIDRRALPMPSGTNIDEAKCITPRTPLEIDVIAAWEEVLEVKPIGLEDDFFALGGHSLLAVRLMSALKRRLGVTPPLAVLFEHSTVEAFAAAVERMSTRDLVSLRLMSRAAGEAAYAGLSSTERRMWFLHRLHPQSLAYQVPVLLRVRGEFDIAAFQSSLHVLAQRHEILRTAYPSVDGSPLRVVSPESNVPVRFVDCSQSPEFERTAAVTGLLRDEIACPFDLENGPLIRVVCIRQSAETSFVLVHQHHIISDEWSNGVMVRELIATYDRLRRNDPLASPALPDQYADVARAERDALEGDRFAASRSYWREKLDGMPRVPLPIVRPAASGEPGPEGHVICRLPLELAHAFAEFARKNQCTPFMAWYAIFAALLSRYTQETDFGIGTVVANRDVPGAEGLLGFFTNTVVLRTDLSGDPTVREVFVRARQTAMEAYRHQAMPFDIVVRDQGMAWQDRESPLFAVSIFEVSSPPPIESNAWSIEREGQSDIFPTGLTSAKDALAISIEHRDGEATLGAFFDTTRVDRFAAERLLGHLQTMALDAMDHPDKRWSELSILSDAEWAELRQWNDPAAPLPADQCIHTLFEQQANQTPDALAVVSGPHHLTYAQLDRQANRLALHLRSLGVKADVLVGLCVERSMNMIVAMLGILKAGGAYVPIDPELPVHRLRYVLDEPRVSILVTQSSLASRLRAEKPAALPLVCVDEPLPLPVAPLISADIAPDHLAYVVYTSGSTGEPKGVMVEHRSVVAHISAYVQFHRLTPADRVLALTPPHFDASVEQIFPALACGACVVVADWDFEPQSFSEKLVEFGITRLDTSGAHWRALVDTWLADPQLAERLRLHTMMVGGDVMPAEVLSRWRKTGLAQRARLVNVYGPTETTVAATAYEVTNEFDGRLPRIPIGKPYSNRMAFVLDRHLRPLPVGIPGELFIGGIGPARGYLHQPELTAEKFIDVAALPFVEALPPAQRNGRVYRTGDLCLWLPDGSLDFLGRTDNQVKLRGYRLELGEIEAHLRRLPHVDDTVVLVHQQGLHKSLVAYVVLSDETGRDFEEVLAVALRQTLPEYMIPSRFVAVAEIPRSSTTGKVVRSKLPEPSRRTSKERTAPRTKTELRIAEIFKTLLKCADVAIDDDFFELGGHSLLATQLVSRLHRSFAIHLPLRAVFEHRSVATLGAVIERDMHASGASQAMAALPQVRRDVPLPLSFGQERLWFLDRMGQGAAFHVPLSMRLEGPLDVEALRRSLSEIVRRHESLRTIFITQNDEPRQVVRSPVDVELPVVDLRELPAADREAEIERRVLEEALAPFDLSTDLMLRTSLLWLTHEPTPVYVFLATMHHIASDGWSLDVFSRELSALYRAFVEGRPSPLPELTLQPADVAVWQRKTCTPEKLAPHFDYWKNQLANASALLQLPLDRPRSATAGKRGTIPFQMDAHLTSALRALGMRVGATMFMTLLAAFQVLLARHANQDDLVVGTPVAGRNREEIEPLIGFFVNNLPIRTNLSADPTFLELLTRVRHTVQDAFAHQDLPFEKLVEQISPERSSSHHPIFQVVFAFHEFQGETLSLPGIRATPLESFDMMARLDLEMHLGECKAGLDGLLHYNRGLFDSASIAAMIARFRTLLHGIILHPHERVGELPLLTANERYRVLIEMNATATTYPAELCAHELIEAQALRTPDVMAVVHDDGVHIDSLTYRQLLVRARQLAHHLQSLGVGPEKLVGLCLAASVERIVGLLGILIAGGAYLPLDPSYPRQRLEFMLHETRPAVIVTQARWVEAIPAIGAKFVCLDRDAAEIVSMPESEPERQVHPDNLAYVIFTSGSTGKPKGVLVPHRGLVNVADAQGKWFRLGPGDKVLQWASLSFDSAVAEIWMTLSVGATLYLGAQDQVLPGEPLLRFLRRHEISMVTLTPSALANVPVTELPAPHTLAVAGEACTPALVEMWARGRRFLNLYGPTEATIWSTTKSCADPADASIIGRHIQNTQVYVLDRRGNPVPEGTSGELYLGGVGVTRGYLNRPAITAERFVPNPFGEGRLYRTGDRVRLRADGHLEFLGRTDEQIKIRGFRVELGEIEAALCAHLHVREAAVVLREDNAVDKRLVAYIVPGVKVSNVWLTLREHLRRILPEFMIPNACIVLDQLPRLPSGKLDRQALPSPDDAANPGIVGQPPRTRTEKVLAEIWCAVLRRPSVDVHERFFDLGGHSLLVARVAARIHRELRCPVPLAVLFERTTIASIAEWIDVQSNPSANDVMTIRPVPRSEPLPLSFVQQRLWSLCQVEPDPSAHNIATAYRVSGALDVGALDRALAEIVRRHEALRTNIVIIDGEPKQIFRPADFQLPVIDCREVRPDERAAVVARHAREDSRRIFDLSRDPLFRATLLRVQEATEHVLLLNVHHLVADGTSMGILLRELAELYHAYRNAMPSPLPDLEVQYADYSVWQRAWFSSDQSSAQLAYWQDKLSGAPCVSYLPVESPPLGQPSTNAAAQSIVITEPRLTRLRLYGQARGVTLFVVLLAAFKHVLRNLSGHEDLVVLAPVVQRRSVEIEGVCGHFTNTLAMRTDISSSPTLAAVVEKVRQTVLEAFAHQDVPYGWLMSRLWPTRRAGDPSPFQWSFNMLPAESPAFSLENVEVSPLEGDEDEPAKIDFTLYVAEARDNLRISVLYRTDVFAATTIAGLLDRYREELERVDHESD